MRAACGLLLAARAAAGGFADDDSGIGCTAWDIGLGAGWPGGPLRPAAFAGRTPLARHPMPPGDDARVRTLDLTPLVRDWWAGRADNQGLLLATDATDAEFHAREAPDSALRPQLRLQWADGRRAFIEAAADATISCSTVRGLGRAPTLAARHDTLVALRFELPAARGSEAPARAELILVRTPTARRSAGTLAVHALASPLGPPAAARVDGIAARHPGDRGIGGDPEVLFADGFDAGTPAARWSRGGGGTVDVRAADPRWGWRPIQGPALAVTIPRGEQLGLDWRLRLGGAGQPEPEDLHFRYYLWLAPTWMAAAEGGKLPGLAGTYGAAGWGGRRWDGQKGWSLRGSYAVAPARPGAWPAGVMLGTYAYHAGADGIYGEGLTWFGSGAAGLVPTGRWVCIEQHLRLNRPGQADGLLEVWVDGRLALRRADLRLRDTDRLRIEEVWMNVFHGGVAPAPADLHAFIDGVVVARRYIGPMSP